MSALRTFSRWRVTLGVTTVSILASVRADSPVRVEDALAHGAEIAVFGSYRVQGEDRLTITSIQSEVETDSHFIAVEVTPWLYLKEHSKKGFFYQERYTVYVHDSFVTSLAEWEENGEERLFIWAIEDSMWTHHLGYPLFLDHAGKGLTSKVEAVTKAVEAGKRHGPLSLDGVHEDLNVRLEIENGEATVTVSNQSKASVWLAQLDSEEQGHESLVLAHACLGIDPEETSFAGEEEVWRELRERRYKSAAFVELTEHSDPFGAPKEGQSSTPLELMPGERVSFVGVNPFPSESAQKRHERVRRLKFQVPIFASDELLNPLRLDSNEVEADLFR